MSDFYKDLLLKTQLAQNHLATVQTCVEAVFPPNDDDIYAIRILREILLRNIDKAKNRLRKDQAVLESIERESLSIRSVKK